MNRRFGPVEDRGQQGHELRIHVVAMVVPLDSSVSPSTPNLTADPRFARFIHQIRQPEYTLDPLNLDPLLQLGIADYTFVLSSPTSSSSADASPAPELASTVPPPPHPHRVSLGKGKFSEVLLARKGDIEVSWSSSL